MILVYWLIAINILTFIIYGVDKYKAKNDRWRISEGTLLLLPVLFCGSIGAGLGMLIWHHKIRKPKFYITVPVFIAIHTAMAAFCLYQNYNLQTTVYDIDLGIGEDLTIVQVSDLHNGFWGSHGHILTDRIADEDPDLIVVTGDILDSYHTSYSLAEDFIREAVKIAPVCYITGNHEDRLDRDRFARFEQTMTSMGVTILDDTYTDMGGFILAGIADSSLQDFCAYPPFSEEANVILLAHEPRYIGLYDQLNADLVLTGHIHGGQIIIPGRGGLLSPDLEFFPEYYEGIYTEGNTSMIVSRGIGNSALPVRINDYPELVVVNLH